MEVGGRARGGQIRLVLENLGIRDLVGSGKLDSYGTVPAKRVLEILSMFVSEFVMEGKAAPESLLNGRAQKYPEVTIARRSSGR